MNRSILLAFVILTGLFFNSCNNKKSKNEQIEVTNENQIEKKETAPKLEKKVAITDFSKQSVDDELADKIKSYITSDFLEEGDLRAIKEEQRKFQIYKIDLNKDGKEEIFVNFITSYFCGTGGCTVLLLDSNLELINRFSPTQTLYIEEDFQNDWKVIRTKSEGKWRKIVYENNAYPSNPTMVEEVDESPSEDALIMFNEENSNAKTYTF